MMMAADAGPAGLATVHDERVQTMLESIVRWKETGSLFWPPNSHASVDYHKRVPIQINKDQDIRHSCQYATSSVNLGPPAGTSSC